MQDNAHPMRLGMWRTLTVRASLLSALRSSTLVVNARSPDFALDFREAYLPAADALLEVGSPGGG